MISSLFIGTVLKNLEDLDGDGVEDSVDQCPNTEPGDLVDSSGCIDTTTYGIIGAVVCFGCIIGLIAHNLEQKKQVKLKKQGERLTPQQQWLREREPHYDEVTGSTFWALKSSEGISLTSNISPKKTVQRVCDELSGYHLKRCYNDATFECEICKKDLCYSHNYGTHGRDAMGNFGDKCKKCFNYPPGYYDGSV